MVVAAAVAAEDVAVAEAVVAVETNMLCHQKSRMVLQFHITGRCNLQCRHCYRTEGNQEPLSLQDVLMVIEQFKELVAEYNSRHKVKKKGHINLTGGEPFFRQDMKEILKYLGANCEWLSYGILSNGSFIDEPMISSLQETGVSFIQLSIDGDRKMHDFLRADGDYDRVLQTAEHLEQKGIRTYISFTANKENYRYIPKVAWECRRRKITKLWSDRLVPIGNGQEMGSLAITENEMPDYIKILKRSQGNFLLRMLFPRTRVTMNRALQFQNSKGTIYSCSAGKMLLTVDEFGNVMPCRRMPICCGTVFETTLRDIYYNHEVFRDLRNCIEPKECKECPHSYFCKGGAKCQSYACFGTFYRADPACPKRGCYGEK